MEYINSSDLTLIGQGANSKVYRYSKPYGNGGLPAVVKIGRDNLPYFYQKNLELLKHAGLLTIAFAEPCSVEGNPAVIMYDLNAGDEVFVSPNTVRNNCRSEAEDYLLANKIDDIANFDNLLALMRDIVTCTNGKGIGFDMDMVFFGMKKGESCPSVYYRFVDVDSMLCEPTKAYQLRDNNIISAKEALTLFIKYFVKQSDRQKELLSLVMKYDW